MEINKVTVDLQPSLLVSGAEEMILMPVGDLQYGAPGSNLEAFKRHIDWGMEHGAYFLGMGDFVDVASPSERRNLSRVDLHDSTKLAMEASAEKNLEVVADVLRGTEGRWLGFHRGHHFWKFSDGSITDEWLSAYMHSPYLDWLSKLTISFPGTKLTATVVSTHGFGSSTSMVGPLENQVKKLAASHPDADVVLVAHHSRKVGYPVDSLVGAKPHTRILALTGGFCDGYLVGTSTYVEEGLMTPLNQGAPIIFIRPIPEEKRLDLALLT